MIKGKNKMMLKKYLILILFLSKSVLGSTVENYTIFDKDQPHVKILQIQSTPSNLAEVLPSFDFEDDYLNFKEIKRIENPVTIRPNFYEGRGLHTLQKAFHLALNFEYPIPECKLIINEEGQSIDALI